MNFKICLSAILLVISSSNFSFSQSHLIGEFENIDDWQRVVSDGVTMDLSFVDGYIGKCIKIDYEFKGSGYCGIQKNISLPLPDDYKFTYYLKGNSPNNNLEFKLADASGDNVWWLNKHDFEFPNQWQKMVVKKRDITFAWGPVGGGNLKKVYSLQIIISASQGGKGSVYIDEIKFEKILPPKNPNAKTIVTASSTENGSPNNLLNEKSEDWKSNKNEEQFILIDFQFVKEYGGLIINWDSINYPKSFDILISNDKIIWEKAYANNDCKGDYSFIFLKNGESRYIKIAMHKSSKQNGYGIKNIKIENFEFSNSYNNFFKEVASFYPKGFFPKYFYDVQSFWDVIGVSEDNKEGLINEEGAIEVDKGSFRVEPFLFTDNKLISWADAKITQSLEDDYLPIPSVLWQTKNLQLEIKTFAEGEAGASSIFIRYSVKNISSSKQNGNFYLSIRPYQVNPPWQFLNIVGGASKIKSIEFKNAIANVNSDKKIIPLQNPDTFGAVNFKDGEIITYINKNYLPSSTSAEDSFEFASGAYKFNFNLEPNHSNDFVFIIPFYDNSKYLNLANYNVDADSLVNKKLEQIKNFWIEKLNAVKFDLPKSADKYINTLRSNLAYILINKDGPAIQPGSRSYERAWIRDGSLTSSALLRLGIKDEVKEYLNWYSTFQYPSGKIPCVVDKRGADPTAENDSHGEFIYAILQYFIFTDDTVFLEDKYDNIKKAVDYIEYLTDQRKTKQYQSKDSLAFYGLMPESISHEGYSAKPMHSYWDDFFTIRGLKDAVTIAHILNKTEDEKRYIKLRDEFEKNLYSSINLAMKMHNINYIPGSVELGDFDATSTTIALYPANELHNLPEPQLQNTFDKYYQYFNNRLDSNFDWVNYTPYEIRGAGTFLYLNQKEKTHKLLDFFFRDQYPNEWNAWAEVVWKDKNTPKFIGDIPHTWIGSDYITVVRSIFGYEREGDSSLVLGAGINPEWLDREEGISIINFATQYGLVSYHLQKSNNKIKLEINGDIKIPPGNIVFKSPLSKKIKSIFINGKSSNDFQNNEIKIFSLPANVIVEY